jgi:hypothetical protein
LVETLGKRRKVLRRSRAWSRVASMDWRTWSSMGIGCCGAGGMSKGFQEALELELEGADLFPAVEGVSFDAEEAGGGGGGVAGHEEAGGVLLAGGEGGAG